MTSNLIKDKIHPTNLAQSPRQRGWLLSTCFWCDWWPSTLLEDLRKTQPLVLPPILSCEGIHRLQTNSKTPRYQFNFLQCEYSQVSFFFLYTESFRKFIWINKNPGLYEANLALNTLLLIFQVNLLWMLWAKPRSPTSNRIGVTCRELCWQTGFY